MNENIIKSDYFYSKCIWAVAYGDNPKKTIDYLFNFFCVDASKIYVALIAFLNMNNYLLTDEARENLCVLVRYLKAVFPKSDFSMIDSKIVDNSFTTIDGFILSQYEKRFLYQNAPLALVNSDNKKAYFEFLKSMIANDMDVLITHSPKCDRVVFETDKAVMHANQMLKYIGSANIIMTEYPTVLNNELFLSRVNYISDIMDNIEKSDGTQMIYTKFRDRIK